MPKLEQNSDNSWNIYCPACKFIHTLDSRWQFNGSQNHPTFKPSLLVTWTYGAHYEPRRCHSYITDGKWNYLSDCTHELAGIIVEVPELPY